MEHVARLFGEAWERRRRRRRTLVWIGLSACAFGLLTYALGSARIAAGPGPGVPEPAGTVAARPAALFSQPPYMGVRCPVANSIACDQVGLAIWLKRPAYSVTASIDGRKLAMVRVGDRLTLSKAPRTEFDGYLHPAGITSRMHVRPIQGTSTWLGDPTPFAAVSLLLNYGNGHYVTTRVQIPLMAGWG